MELIINNKIITAPIQTIVKTLRQETGNKYFKAIKNEIDNVLVTCPYHKDGQEQHPSCRIYSNRNNPNVCYGTLHCFTCGASKQLFSVVGDCFGQSDDFGKQWLLERFGNTFYQQVQFLPQIELPQKKAQVQKLLKKFIGQKNSNEIISQYHPYMWKRKLSKQVVDFFNVYYDVTKNTIVFPVYDQNGDFLFVTERSVIDKRFYIPNNVQKPVYALNIIKKYNYTNVIVTESQINCLTCWSWGYPAICLFGTGSQHQYDILNKSGIRVYYLAFDGDSAGRKGAERFKKNINSDVIINQIRMPQNKDVNDLVKMQFDELYNKCSYFNS